MPARSRHATCRSSIKNPHIVRVLQTIKPLWARAWHQLSGQRPSFQSNSCAPASNMSVEALSAAHSARYTTQVLPVDPRSFPWPCNSNSSLSSIDSDSSAPIGLAARPPTSTYTRDLQHLHQAAELLRRDEIVAMPTETVYGLAANALSADAVRKIFEAKQRPSDNPLIIHISSLEMLRSLYPDGSDVPAVYAPVLARHWPGPLTVLLPRSPLVPECVTCGQPTMAVRMPSHPVARTLISMCHLPLAAPSANSSGRPSPTLSEHVLEDLKGRLPLIIDGGACCWGLESTVLDALRQPPAILRPGSVTPEQLQQLQGMEGLQVYRRDFVDKQLEQAPTTPGMKYRHYSPNAHVVLVDIAGSSNCSREHLQQRLRSCTQQQLDLLRAQGLTRLGLLSTSRQGAAPGLQQKHQQQHQQQAAGGAADVASAAGNGSGPSDCSSCSSSAEVLEFVLGSFDEPQQVGQQLFRGLRELDLLGVQAVVVEGVVEQREGVAVLNRIRKAASAIVQLGM